MGINKPSLYGAFGDKESLFERVISKYAEQDMSYARRALDQPTGYDVARALLLDNVDAVTRPDRPAGCLSIQGGIAVGEGSERVARFLGERRLAGELALGDRLQRAVDDGDLVGAASASDLARYLMAVTEGHAVHAGAGATRAQLRASAELALLAVEALRSS
jgi:AcrR family transcriptional regulator